MEGRQVSGNDLKRAVESEDFNVEKGQTYSKDKENIGNLKYGEIDSVIFSPPYADTFNEKKHTNSGMAKRDESMQQFVGGYGKGEGNVGNLPHGNIDAVITSPPFASSLAGSSSDDLTRFKHGSAGKDYTENKDDRQQVGNLDSQNYLQAMAQIYQQCHFVLKEGGLMVLHTKNFTRKGELVRLDEDTRKLCEFVGFKKIEHVKVRLAGQSFWIRNSKKKFFQKNPHKIMGAPAADFEDLQIFQKGGKLNGFID